MKALEPCSACFWKQSHKREHESQNESITLGKEHIIPFLMFFALTSAVIVCYDPSQP